MNNERILRVTNCFLLLAGSDICWFERKSRRYRPSLWGIVNFACLACFYAICFQHHFTQSPALQLLLDVSPFLHRLMRLQLLLGLKIFLFSIYENVRWVRRAGNGLAEVLPRSNVSAAPSSTSRRVSADEAVAYFLLFSTLLLVLGFVAYIAYEMEFKLPPLDHIFIGAALFIPHFLLAGALRYFTIGVWLLRVELKRLADDLAAMLAEELPQDECSKIDIALIEDEGAVIATTEQRKHDQRVDDDHQLATPLLEMLAQLERLAARQKLFDCTLQRQLGLLLGGMNNNCLLAGAYALTYFDSTWHVMFSERSKRIFYAGVYGIFVFIIWDLLCLCLTKSSFDKVKNNFYENLRSQIKQKRKAVSKNTRALLKDMRDLLAHEFRFNLFGTMEMTTWNLILFQKFLALVIAITVVYNYLNDQIISLTTRLDEVDAAAD